MPLLGKKVFHLAKPLTIINAKESVFIIKHTGECFQSRDEYIKRTSLYNEKIWTCQCTGHINLTHEEAWKSEQDARQQLKKNYPDYLEKPVLEIVHQSISPLDSLIDQAYIKVNSMYFPGDNVQFKVKNGGRIIRSRVLSIDTGKDNENRLSPCSDKENADNADCNHNENSPRKYPPKLLPYKYNIRLLDEDKIVRSVPAEDIVRCDRAPNKDLLRLFIRAHAVRHGTNPTSPWIVDPKIVRKYSLPNKLVESSPAKVTDSKNEESKRKLNEDIKSLTKKKLKIELKPIASKSAAIGNSKLPTKNNASIIKQTAGPNFKTTPAKSLSVKLKQSESIKIPSYNVAVPAKQKSKKLNTEKEADEIVIIAEKINSPKSSINNSSKLDHSYSSPINRTNGNKFPLGVSLDSSKISDRQPVVKLVQLETTIRRNNEESPSKKRKIEYKTLKKNVATKKVHKENLRGKDKTMNISGTQQKKLKQMTLLDLSIRKAIKTSTGNSKIKSPQKVSASKLKSPGKEKDCTPKKLKKTNSENSPKNWMKINNHKKNVQGKNDNLPIKRPEKILKPLTPSQTLMYIQKIAKFLENPKDKAKITPLVDRLIITLSKQQIEALPEMVKQRIHRRIVFKEVQAKFAGLSKEERLKLLKERRKATVKTKRKNDAEAAKLTRPMEDKMLNLIPLPQPELVPTPEGVPNELFGDIVMVVEFINCYCGLLMPNEPYPVHTELLLKAVGSGNEGYGYLSRILLILLQSLLQDKIAEEYKELGVRLSDLPINIHTTSELVRLCLRKEDEDHANVGEESTDGNEDVPDDVLSLLETSELYELIPQHKMQIIIGICHRIMNSYSVQDYMEQKQKQSAALWKDIAEHKKIMAASKHLWDEEVKANEDATKTDKNTVKTDENAMKTDEDATVKIEEGQKPLEQRLYSEKNQKSNESEDSSDQSLAFLVKRRHSKEDKIRLQKQKKEDSERKERENEKRVLISRQEELNTRYQKAVRAARIALRQSPLGFDRNHTRYWLFSHGTLGLYLEKGWVKDYIEYAVEPSKELPITKYTDEVCVSESEDEPLAVLQKKNKEVCDSKDSEPLIKLKGEPQQETSVPVVGQNLWFQYRTAAEIETLLSSLHQFGLREGSLLKKLRQRQGEIMKSFLQKIKPSYVMKPSKGDQELLVAFKKELTETEVRVQKGLLGGVPNLTQWEKRLEAATGIQDLISCLLETQANVLPRFLQGIMKMFTQPDDDEKKSEDEGKVHRWIEAVENCQTMSRLHVLLGVLDACILWEKSTENAKCKICRRQDEDLVLILCDNCNLAFHLFCLRPALTEVPQGEWMCPACQPSSRSDRLEKLEKKQKDEVQTIVTNSEETSSQTSSSGRCLRSGTYINFKTRGQNKNENWKEESSENEDDSVSESDEEEEDELNGNDTEGSEECCLCGGDEDVICCSKCNLGYHTFCHVPPMHNKPRGKWTCNPCLTGKKPKSIRSARMKWQKWKLPTPEKKSVKTKSFAKREKRKKKQTTESAKQITRRLRQRIDEAVSENPNVPKISTRQARALKRALHQDK